MKKEALELLIEGINLQLEILGLLTSKLISDDEKLKLIDEYDRIETGNNKLRYLIEQME